jgi:hypothetical protein
VSELKPARLEEICAKCGKPLDVRPGETFRADTAGRVWHYGCAPTASPTPTNDGEGLIERMEGRIRILVWNREKAAGKSDEAAMKAVEKEIAALNQGAGQ